MKIIVKNLKGKQFEIDVEDSNTIRQVKEKIEEEQKIEADKQKLVAVGKVMDETKTVADYKLKEGDFIVVMVSKIKPKPKTTPPATTAPTPSQAPAPSPPVADPSPAPADPSPAPVPGTGAEAAPASEGGNAFMSGEELEKALKDMQDMGFPKDECMRALRAAFYDVQRAIDYLLNGIPENPDPQPAPSAPPGGAATTGAGATEGAGAGLGAGLGAGGDDAANPLGFLNNNPMFEQLRQRLLREPQFFQTFMNQLAQTHPQLHQAISQNQAAFLQLLLQGGTGGGAGGEGADPPGTIRVTQEEKDAIERLAALGFPKHRAIEAYFAWDKNEEWAANYLFENNMADDNYENQLAQEESLADAQANNPGLVANPPAAAADQPPADPPAAPSDQPPANPPAGEPANSPAEAPANQPAEAPAQADDMQVDAPAADAPPAEAAPAEAPAAENPPAENPPADANANQDAPMPDANNNGNNANGGNEDDEEESSL